MYNNNMHKGGRRIPVNLHQMMLHSSLYSWTEEKFNSPLYKNFFTGQQQKIVMMAFDNFLQCIKTLEKIPA